MEVGEILNDWDPSWKVSNVDEVRWLPDELKFQLTWHGKTGWRQQKITKQLNWTLKRSKSWNWSWFWSQEKWSNSPTALVVGLSSPSFWEHPALLRPEDVAPRKAEMVLEQVGYQNDTTKQWLLSWEDVLPLNPLDPFESFSSLQAATWEYWQPPPPFQVLLCPCLGCYVMSRKSLVSKHCKHFFWGKHNLFHGYRSLCNALKRRSKVVEKVLGVHSALAIATVPRAVECQEKMWLPALTTQVLRYHLWLRGGTLLQARCYASSTW